MLDLNSRRSAYKLFVTIELECSKVNGFIPTTAFIDPVEEESLGLCRRQMAIDTKAPFRYNIGSLWYKKNENSVP